MMRVFLIGFLVLAIATVAIADNSFRSQGEVSRWVMYYYQKPEPSKVPEAIHYMSESKLLDGRNPLPPIFGFLAGIFSENPGRVSQLVKGLETLPETHLGVLVLGLWYAKLPDSQRLVYAFLDSRPNLKKDFEFLYKGSPMSIEDIPLEQGPWVLDALWGNFMATGSKVPVLRIASALPWVDTKGDTNRLLVGGAARWSLTSNAEQHKRVLEICKAEVAGQSKEVREKLREVIAEATKGQNK